MYDKSQTTAIFSTAQSGLQSSLQYLLQNNTDGITKTILTNTLANNTTGVNSAFYQMISNQFSTLDKNNDGTITSDEANNMLNTLSTNGLTKDQVSQMRYQGTIDEELADKIISNFSKIDTNGDGYVSEAEINAYCLQEEKQAKQDEQQELLLKNMSCYYDVDIDTSSSSSSTSSKKSSSSS